MAKRKKRNSRPLAKSEEPPKQPIDKKLLYAGLARLGALVAVTAVVFVLYRILINQYFFEITLIVYMSVAAAVTLAYVIYNRGFSRRGLTPEMLPDTMSPEEKQEFIDDGERRLKKSRPLVTLIFAFAFTFVFDIIELVAIPLIQRIFS